jgi:hypothetical protein
MADLGSVGTNCATEPDLAVLVGAPLFYNPLNRSVVVRNDGPRGPEPAIAVSISGVPFPTYITLVSQFGAAGGGISIF